ncbi:hypothetical protein U1Q18_029803 [Sarracenia purpurea var. burkii]
MEKTTSIVMGGNAWIEILRWRMVDRQCLVVRWRLVGGWVYGSGLVSIGADVAADSSGGDAAADDSDEAKYAGNSGGRLTSCALSLEEEEVHRSGLEVALIGSTGICQPGFAAQGSAYRSGMAA